MAIGVYFSPDSFPVDKYDSTLKDLEARAPALPTGRLYHCAMEAPGGVHVFDVWESMERVRGVRRHVAADPRQGRGRPRARR